MGWWGFCADFVCVSKVISAQFLTTKTRTGSYVEAGGYLYL